MALPKAFKGDKYIYLLMALRLIQNTGKNYLTVGADTGFVGGQNYHRRFTLNTFGDKLLLIETKSSKSFADFSKTYEVLTPNDQKPTIREYIDESGDNWSANWVH